MTKKLTFEEMQKRFKEIQQRWDALTPDQKEAERKKYAAYDARIMAEDDHDEENDESPD